jgi:hypothetical protein
MSRHSQWTPPTEASERRTVALYREREAAAASDSLRAVFARLREAHTIRLAALQQARVDGFTLLADVFAGAEEGTR